MPPRSIVLNKPLGQTPLQALEDWRRAHPEHASLPATYAGRLDPMAEGKLLVLLGDECKRQERYRGLDKEYEIEVLLDIATDTGDVLGIPAFTGMETRPSARALRSARHAHEGAHTVPYPAFSSKTVHGKPLFQYALEGTLDTITTPTHTERIHRIRPLGTNRTARTALHTRIKKMLAHAPRAPEASKELGADFRQDAIRAAWDTLFTAIPDREFCIVRLRVTAASGTYMRTLADRIGRFLGTRGMALSIRRTRIGTYRRVFGTGFWTRRY